MRLYPSEEYMRSPIRKRVVAYFTNKVQERFPQFIRMAMPGDTSRLWAFRMVPSLTFFILLQPFDREDQFVVEVAWSEDSDFPWGSFGKILVGDSHGRARLPVRGEIGTIGQIWDLAPEATAAIKAELKAYSRGEAVPYRDINPPIENVLPRVEPMVDESIDRLAEVGLPFLRRVADHRKITWPQAGDNEKRGGSSPSP
jgi:hypothetical protein